MKKKCTICKDDKEFEEFNKNKSKSDGLNNVCKKCANEHSRKYYKSNSERMIKQINEGNRKRIKENQIKVYEYYSKHSCIDCGEDDPIVLEFDHVTGKKFKPVSLLVSGGYSWSVIEKEMKKCVVRCANCHRRKTAKDFGWYKHSFSIGGRMETEAIGS